VAGEAIDWPDDLTDGVVIVRRLARQDSAAFARAFADDPTLGVMIGVETDPDVAEVEAQATEERPGRLSALAIADADDGAFLGGIGIYRLDMRHRRGEVGFWLAPGARGRGAASRAVRMLTSWAFESLGLERVELTTSRDNAPTRALAARLGFAEEGTMRARNLERGRRVDVVMYAVLKDEWRG
jgi:RimJ/RimL family protein N-acetyltransferase